MLSMPLRVRLRLKARDRKPLVLRSGNHEDDGRDAGIGQVECLVNERVSGGGRGGSSRGDVRRHDATLTILGQAAHDASKPRFVILPDQLGRNRRIVGENQSTNQDLEPAVLVEGTLDEMCDGPWELVAGNSPD